MFKRGYEVVEVKPWDGDPWYSRLKYWLKEHLKGGE